MRRRFVLMMTLAIVLISVLGIAPKVQRVEAQGGMATFFLFGETSTGTHDYFLGPDTKGGTIFTLPEDGIVTEISVYMGAGFARGEHIRVFIYSVSGGEPYRPEVVSEEIEGEGVEKWYHAQGGDLPKYLPADEYLLGYISDSSVQGRKAAATSDWKTKSNDDDYADDTSDPFGTPTTYVSQRLCIYATYVVSTPVTLTITTTAGGTTNPAPGDHDYPEGGLAHVTAIPDVGYRFDHWELDGVNAGTANPIEVTTDTAHALHAVFVLVIHTLTVTATADGTTNPPSGPYHYIEGDVAQVAAIPDPGYVFYYWEVDGIYAGRGENPINITMDADHTLHAVFVTPPKLLYGVCSHPFGGLLELPDWEEMQKLGIEYVRFDFPWDDLERDRDVFSWEKYDLYVSWARQYGIKIIGVFLNIPRWMYDPWPDEWKWEGREKFSIPPLDTPEWNDFIHKFGQLVYTVVDHFKDDIKFWEVWNEENFMQFWGDSEAIAQGDYQGSWNRGVAIEKYVMMLQEAYTQAKTADPTCKIIVGGLSHCDYDYVQGMYDYGARGYFDYLGIHPYVSPGRAPEKNYDFDYVDWDDMRFDYFPKIELVREVMVANGDGQTPMLITELGIYLGAPGPEGPTTEEIQAERLARVFQKIRDDPGYPYIHGVMWYQFRCDVWGLVKGPDYTPTLQYYAYQEEIQTPVIPEFPPNLFLPLFMIATLLAVIVYQRKRSM